MEITENKIFEVAYDLLKKSYTRVNKPVFEAYKKAYEKETNPISKGQLKVLIDCIEKGMNEDTVICQDTGTPTFYITIGSDSGVKVDIKKVLTDVTAKMGVELPLRHHIVNPVTGEFPETVTGVEIPVVWFDYLPGADYVEIMAAPRGGGGGLHWIAPRGCFTVPFATEKPWTYYAKKCIIQNFIDGDYFFGCGPNTVGICIGGGNTDQSLVTAWKAVYRRPFGSHHPNPEVAQLEKDLLNLYNQYGRGNTRGVAPGLTNVIAVNVELLHTRGEMAMGGPIVLTLLCNAYRDERARIHADGRVEYLEA